MHHFVLFLLAVLVLGVVGIVSIYLKFFAVLVSLLFTCLKAAADSIALRVFSEGAVRRLSARKP